MRKLLKILAGLGAAVSGLFLAWASCVDLTHWVKMCEHVTLAWDMQAPYCHRTAITRRYRRSE